MHKQKKLALLVSLIGAGFSPYACARTELWIAGSPKSALDIALAVPAATAGDNTRWAPGFTWRTDEEAFDLPMPFEGLYPVERPSTEWAPGELAEGNHQWSVHAPLVSPVDRPADGFEGSAQSGAEAETAAPDRQEAKAAETITRPNEPELRVRVVAPRAGVLAQRFRAAPAMAEVDGGEPTSRSISSISPTAGLLDAPPHPAHMARLMETLAAVVLDDEATARDDPASRRTKHTPPPVHEPSNPEPERIASVPGAGATAPGVERRDIVVSTESGKVLRSLEAILSGERDEVGAIYAGGRERVVATHAEKVLQELDDVLSARDGPETGSARRARKLAALQQMVEVQAVAARHEPAASAELPGRADSPASVEPIAAVAGEGIEIDVDLSQPRAGELVPSVASTASTASTGDDVAPAVTLASPAVSAAVPTEPESKARLSPFGSETVALSEQSLDGVRGGFVANGLTISFGIERAVYVNGTLVTTTSLNVSELGRITGGRGTMTFDSGTIALIQNGTGSVVAPGAMSSASIGTVVQNTLDGQKIQNVTVVNASVSSLGVLRGLNLQSSLRSAVIDSLRR